MTMKDFESKHVPSDEERLAALDGVEQPYVTDRVTKLVFGEAGLGREDTLGIALHELEARKQRLSDAVRKPDFYEDQSLGARRDVRTDTHTLSADEKIDMDRDTPAHKAYVAHFTEVAGGVAERA
jgi:hypothetical protein